MSPISGSEIAEHPCGAMRAVQDPPAERAALSSTKRSPTVLGSKDRNHIYDLRLAGSIHVCPKKAVQCLHGQKALAPGQCQESHAARSACAFRWRRCANAGKLQLAGSTNSDMTWRRQPLGSLRLAAAASGRTRSRGRRGRGWPRKWLISLWTRLDSFFNNIVANLGGTISRCIGSVQRHL